MTQDHQARVEAARTHELKTDPEVYDAVASGAKTYEIRKNDRGFAVGDHLWLRRTKYTGGAMAGGAPLEYTGESLHRTVSHVLKGYALRDDWVILSFAPASPARAQVDAAREECAGLIAGLSPYDRADALDAIDRLAALASAPLAPAAGEPTAQEPDCWAILTPNGSKLVSPQEAQGCKTAYPLYTAPQPPAASNDEQDARRERIAAVDERSSLDEARAAIKGEQP